MFFDVQQGWALGDASALYPGGVFRTSDGGRSWASLAGRMTSTWLTGDFVSLQGGVVAGVRGSLATASLRGVERARSINVSSRAIRRILLQRGTALGRQAGWAVGDGGLVLFSGDGGHSWQESLGRLPTGMYDHFDYRALAVVGSSCWIAGAPGTRVLHSSDGGQNWQVFDTGQTLPIRAMCFLDQSRGWAVGSLGLILATRDGGQTWLTQRRSRRRAALLAVCSTPASMPLELLARLAGGEGYLSVVEVIGTRQPGCAEDGKSPLAQRTQDAVVAVGASQASIAWNFPLRPAGLSMSAQSILDDWNRSNRGQGRRQLEDHLVRAIRQWRPDVVVTEPANPREGDAVAHVVNQALLAAVNRAADPSSCPRHVSQAGLEPWQVKKVFSCLGADVGGTLNLTASQLAPRSGCPLSDQAERGWALLRETYLPPPQTLGFRLLINRLTHDLGRKDFFSGLNISADGEARRALSAPVSGDMRTISRIAVQRRNVERLLQVIASRSYDTSAWLAQVETLIRELDDAAGGQVVFRLARTLERTGQMEPTAQLLDYLVRRYPDHVLCQSALLWLVRYHSSGEAAWSQFCRRRSLRDESRAQQAPAAHVVDQVRRASFELPVEAGVTVPAGGESGSTSKGPDECHREQRRRALAYGELLRNSHPSLYADPVVRFSLAATQRQLGHAQDAERYFHALAGGSRPGTWRDRARGELWADRPSRHPPVPVSRCVRARGKPLLDGRLDDDMWSACTPTALASERQDDAQWPATVLLAYDAEYLYLACSCAKAPAVAYPTDESPRPRDPDLRERDRVELRLDVDRDYSTCFRFTVDHRGWAADACLGNAAWNPQWYVASNQHGEAWSVEAAIPWSAVAAAAPAQGDLWAGGLKRIVPAVGWQAWPPAYDAGPASGPFGLLMFE
jgi:photosystem II stability/assembly factor-like uncharacterized protein